jgi:hypothetical protein
MTNAMAIAPPQENQSAGNKKKDHKKQSQSDEVAQEQAIEGLDLRDGEEIQPDLEIAEDIVPCIPEWIQILSLVCFTILCFAALNIFSLGNSELPMTSISWRTFGVRLVCYVFERAVRIVSESYLKGIGIRTRCVLMMAIFGLISGVLTTISQIDSQYRTTSDTSTAETEWESTEQYNSDQTSDHDSEPMEITEEKFSKRPIIISSAFMACLAVIWASVTAIFVKSPSITFAGGSLFAVISAFLLWWGAQDQGNLWILMLFIWYETLLKACLLLVAPLPFWYTGVAVINGIVISTASSRRAIVIYLGILDSAVLILFSTAGQTLRLNLGPIEYAYVVSGLRTLCVIFLIVNRYCLKYCFQSPENPDLNDARLSCATLNPCFGCLPINAPKDPAARKRWAKYGVMVGRLTAEGKIQAKNIFEFNPRGVDYGWEWVMKDGQLLTNFTIPPMSEYRQVAKEVTPLTPLNMIFRQV